MLRLREVARKNAWALPHAIEAGVTATIVEKSVALSNGTGQRTSSKTAKFTPPAP